LPLDKPIALFFGTEKLGLSKDVIDNADEYMTIPMYGFTESFNISVSVALCLNVLSRKIRELNINWQFTEEEQQMLKFEWTKRHLLSWQLYEKEFNARRMAKKIQ
jgi:tRNA (guanosine-2'-O-)-methyltransferase